MNDAMQKIRGTVQLLAVEELNRANEIWPQFNSKHEAIGVLDEELFEMAADLEQVEKWKRELHEAVYRDYFLKDRLQHLEAALTNAIAEGIQCIAMCKKFHCYLESEDK